MKKILTIVPFAMSPENLALRQQQLQGLQFGSGDEQGVHGKGLRSMVFGWGAGQGSVAQDGGGDATGDDEQHA